MRVPKSLVDTKFSPGSFKKETHLKIVALRREQQILYSSSHPREDHEIVDFNYKTDDILVLLGEIKDIRKFLHG